MAFVKEEHDVAFAVKNNTKTDSNKRELVSILKSIF